MNIGPKDIGLAIFLIVVLLLFSPALSWFLRRRREKRVMAARGAQTVDEFALSFETETERQIARRIYPRIQGMTISGRLSLDRDDLLLGSPLNLDAGNLMNEIEGLSAELNTPERELESALQEARTAGDFVEMIAAFIDKRK